MCVLCCCSVGRVYLLPACGVMALESRERPGERQEGSERRQGHAAGRLASSAVLLPYFHAARFGIWVDQGTRVKESRRLKAVAILRRSEKKMFAGSPILFNRPRLPPAQIGICVTTPPDLSAGRRKSIELNIEEPLTD
jgi:hypothetical protein